MATSVGLAAIGALHVAWGRGSPFPFASQAEMAEAVIGSDRFPPAWASYAVAGALFSGAALVADPPMLPGPQRKVGVGTLAVVLATRSVFGFLGRTDLISPGSEAPRFRRLDNRVYSPLCAALAVGAVASIRPRR